MAIVNWNLLEVCLIPEKEQSELTHNVLFAEVEFPQRDPLTG